jgi:Flp pilus assembly protein TadD/TolB-like protein
LPPSIGMRFSRFELVSRLASGGMGDVWRARDQDLHRDVAVKFLPERFAADPARLGRFAQEARAASQLNHPNIVTIHEIGETSGLPYIVMELVDGHTLRDLLLSQERRPLPPRRLLEIAAQAADGLAKAHAAGIVHRDLKPENLMVTNDGFVKILDFGLAKLRGEGAMPQGTARRSATGDLWFDSGQPTWPESPSPHTAVGAVIGTTGYMSPEQARGLAVDFRSDQFTFGAILYELATGQQAFRRETPAQTIAAIIEDQPEPLATRNPSLPGPLRWVIERCLAKDPAERYASTLDLSRELRGLREHIGEVGGSGSSPAGPLRPVARRRMLTLGLVALVAVPLATWLGPPLIDRATLALGLRPLPEQRHVAVLPFRTPSPTPEDRALADGIAELLTVRLAQLERFRGTLWVEPSSNVAQAGVTSADRAGRALGVTLVVTGSVQRLDGRLLLTATLEDASRNRTLRAATASGIDGLVEAVVSMLALELNASEVAQLRAWGSGVAEAGTLTAQAFGYSAWGEARSALDRYEQSQRLESAIELFNRALEHDPRYALAHAGLAEAYWRLYENELKPELVSLAEQHSERALALDDLGPTPWITLGMIHAGSGRAELALADFQKALDRDPRNASAQRELGRALERLGRFDDAEARYKRAIELKAESWSSHNYLGAFLHGRSRFVEAEAEFRRALAIAPDNVRVWSNLGGALYFQDRYQDAEAAWRRALQLGSSPTVTANIAALQFSEKRYGDAARTLEAAASSGTSDYRVWRNLGAALYWAPGERSKAAAAYRHALPLAERELKVDPKNARILAHLADCHAMLDEADEARALGEQAGRLAPADRRVAVLLAGVYEHIGDRAAALHWLAAALKAGQPRSVVESDPTFEKLREDPRWLKLAKG